MGSLKANQNLKLLVLVLWMNHKATGLWIQEPPQVIYFEYLEGYSTFTPTFISCNFLTLEDEEVPQLSGRKQARNAEGLKFSLWHLQLMFSGGW